MRILGVDPGLTVGLAIIEYREERGSWRCLKRWDYRPDVEDRGEALSRLATVVNTNIADYRCLAVAMEEMLAYRQASADEKVEAQAIVKLTAYQKRLPLHTYAPATVRSVVCGTGRADPKGVRDTLRFLLRMPKRAKKGEGLSPHQQDAVSVALCHLKQDAGLQVLDRCEEVGE